LREAKGIGSNRGNTRENTYPHYREARAGVCRRQASD
jgi:hypothetical protein